MHRTSHTIVGRLCLASLSFAVAAPALCAQAPAEPPPRPKYQLLRQNEDWSRFDAARVDPAERRLFDSLKHVPLDVTGDVWASFGGRLDWRFEAWDGFGFGAQTPGNSDAFLLSRLMLHGDLHLGPRVRVFVETIAADVLGRDDLPGGRRTIDTNTLDLFQGFADWLVLDGERSLRLRFGRQTLLFGAQRLVSPLPWVNAWRTWDGVSAEFRTGPWRVTGFATLYAPVQKYDFDDADEDQQFYGVYASRGAIGEGRGFDVYLLGKSRDGVTVNGTTGDERRHTLGARSHGSLGAGFDGELEGAWQWGEVGSGDVEAWFVAAVLGYRVPDWPTTPRFFTGFDVATGDARPGGDVGTFDQVFPLAHAYFGYADVIARQNVVAAHLGAELRLAERTNLSLTGHVLRLHDGDDALYGVNGAPSRTGLGSRDVGQEVDLYVSHDWNAQLSSYAGYSHVFAGDGIAASGADEDIDFFYLALTARF